MKIKLKGYESPEKMITQTGEAIDKITKGNGATRDKLLSIIGVNLNCVIGLLYYQIQQNGNNKEY